ncbi:2-deoxy-5-keto-D-gluconate 6-phosphate aldolase domain-containing protein, partial [Flavobacterium chungangensis]
MGPFKSLCLRAAQRVADGKAGYGILCDARLGREALHAAAGTGLWIGRPVERPGSRPARRRTPSGGRPPSGAGTPPTRPSGAAGAGPSRARRSRRRPAARCPGRRSRPAWEQAASRR